MEPSDLNPSHEPDLEFEVWLRKSAALQEIQDNGFSARVASALPRPEVRLPSWTRVAFSGGGAVLGVIAVSVKWSSAGAVGSVSHDLQISATSAIALLTNPGLNLAMAVIAITLISARWHRRRPFGL